MKSALTIVLQKATGPQQPVSRPKTSISTIHGPVANPPVEGVANLPGLSQPMVKPKLQAEPLATHPSGQPQMQPIKTYSTGQQSPAEAALSPEHEMPGQKVMTYPQHKPNPELSLIHANEGFGKSVSEIHPHVYDTMDLVREQIAKHYKQGEHDEGAKLHAWHNAWSRRIAAQEARNARANPSLK